LIVLIEEFKLRRTLPRGTITWRQGSRQSTIDLTFVTPLLRDSFVGCEIAEDMDTHSDHYLIRTVFDLHTIAAEQIVRRNCNKIDLKLLRGTLAKEILTETALKPAN